MTPYRAVVTGFGAITGDGSRLGSFPCAPGRAAITREASLYASRSLEGCQLGAYAWPGASDAVAVAFINGMEERWNFCDPLRRELTPQYRAFSLELPWSGTQGNRWGRRVDGAEWVRAGLDLLALDRPVLVAHSFGANALLSFLDRYGTERVRAAVFVSPFYKPRQEDFDWAVLRYYLDEFPRLLECGLEARSGAARLSPEWTSAMAERVRDRIGPYGWLQFFDSYSRTPDLALDRVTIPCLVLGGETDFASTPEDCRQLAAGLPMGEAHILPGCGHFCITQQPQAVALAINAFLTRHLADPTEASQS